MSRLEILQRGHYLYRSRISSTESRLGRSNERLLAVRPL